MVLFLLIFVFKTIFANNDTTYIKPSELEPGWGLYWTDSRTQTMWIPDSLIVYLNISPDGNWLVYRDLNYMQLLNLQTKQVRRIADFGDIPLWSPDSKIISFIDPYLNLSPLYLYLLSENKLDSITCIKLDSTCSYGNSWAYDNNLYFSHPKGFFVSDSSVFRMNFDSSLKVGYPVHDLLNGIKMKYAPVPVFPPGNLNFYVSQDINDIGIDGFDLTTNFDFNNRKSVKIPPPDTGWIYSGCNTFGMPESSYLLHVGIRGDVYLYLSYRSKKENVRDSLGNFCNPIFWDSSTIAARNASGWYRVDTNGNNLVQLIRSWTHSMGGLSITADGETIYYGMLEKDMSPAIWKMNRFGKNKEMVYKLNGQHTEFIDNKELMPESGISIKCVPYSGYNELKISYFIDNDAGAEIEIYDYYGRLVENRIIENVIPNKINSISINSQSYCTGVYFIQLKSGSKFAFDKFIILK